MLLNIPPTLTASLHYLVKYKICKIHHYLVNIGTKVWSLIFGQSCTTVSSSYVYNTESLSKTKHNLTFRIGQKLSSKLFVQIFTKY